MQPLFTQHVFQQGYDAFDRGMGIPVFLSPVKLNHATVDFLKAISLLGRERNLEPSCCGLVPRYLSLEDMEYDENPMNPITPVQNRQNL